MKQNAAPRSRRPVSARLALAATLLTATALGVPATGAAARPPVMPGVAAQKTTYGASKAVVAAAAAYKPTANFTATWKRADALKVHPDPTTTTPRVDENFPIMTDQVWVWDTWPLTDMQTRPITYKGWKVIFSLTAPAEHLLR